MGESKLRMKFNEHEFEIEGPVDHVERQFEIFRQMVQPDIGQMEPIEPAVPSMATTPAATEPETLALNKVMRSDGKVVSLTVNVKTEHAVLAILLGQRHFRQNNSVSGMEIMNGLRSSGFDVPRADTMMAKHASEGSVVATGRRKLRRYRLSTDGIARAEQIVRSLISQLSP